VSKTEKLLMKFQKIPKDFTWDELVKLLAYYGFEMKKGDGSRRNFKERGLIMKDLMEYKGYYGSVHYSFDDNVLFGKLEGIRSLIAYQAEDVRKLKQVFEESVDDYLNDCKIEKIKPEKPYKGSFHIRVNSELHYKAAALAEKEGKSLNKIVNEALEKCVA